VDIHPLASSDERWLDEGFVRTSAKRIAFQAPVPAILIADAFTDRHCLQAVVGPDSAQDRIGVAFLPRDTVLPDVGGTVWLDVESGALRSVDYDYLYLPAGLEERDPKGHFEFARLADGSWYIDYWWLRQTTTAADTAITTEVGRTITNTAPVFGDVGPRETQIAGVLFDSLHGRPLDGAAVFLWGTDYQTTSDALGRFAFDRGVPPGDYDVSYYHDAVAAWGVIPERVPTTATVGTDTWVVLSVPSAASIVAQRCEDEEGGTLVGSVREAGAGFTLPRARVVLDWSETSRGNVKPGRRVGRADSRGWYYFCGLPVGLPIIARAQFNDEWTTGNTFIPTEESVSMEHLMVEVVERVTASGRVLDADTGEPITGASVGLVGLQGRYFSDSTGSFVFGDVVPGYYELSIVHRDYGAVSDSITIRETGTAEFEVVLSAAAPADALSVRSVVKDPEYVLEPIIVEGKAVEPSMVPFYRRRAAGFGSFITREEFERFIPSDVTDVLRRMPSITVRPNPSYDRIMPNGMIDTRRYRIEVTTRARRTSAQECAPIVFLDGAYLGNTREIDVDVLPVDAIEAMETYALSASLPPEFNRSGAVCGVIALWTRR
jgi:protocatechuate 3,4-dioxygenase beta subunit